MATEFSIEFAVNHPPAEAQARAATSLTEPARAVGLRLRKRAGRDLVYRPRVQFPFLLMLAHYLNGERMTVCFEPADGGGTHVKIAGRVSRSRHSLAADREHWSEALAN